VDRNVFTVFTSTPVLRRIGQICYALAMNRSRYNAELAEVLSGQRTRIEEVARFALRRSINRDLAALFWPRSAIETDELSAPSAAEVRKRLPAVKMLRSTIIEEINPLWPDRSAAEHATVVLDARDILFFDSLRSAFESVADWQDNPSLEGLEPDPESWPSGPIAYSDGFVFTVDGATGANIHYQVSILAYAKDGISESEQYDLEAVWPGWVREDDYEAWGPRNTRMRPEWYDSALEN
jgi:hypothetical protein